MNSESDFFPECPWDNMLESRGAITVPCCRTVTIHDTRLGNWSCDGSGDLSPTFSMFVYVCLCLFTYVWSLDLFWKLYIVPMLRELTSLSFNINYDTLILSLIVWGRPSDWGAQVCTWEPYLDYGGTDHYSILKLILSHQTFTSFSILVPFCSFTT